MILRLRRQGIPDLGRLRGDELGEGGRQLVRHCRRREVHVLQQCDTVQQEPLIFGGVEILDPVCV